MLDKTLSSSELILNPDGSVYHLNLLPEQIANTIITVGDPDRVAKVSQHFDSVEVKVGKREFHTHTGHLNGKRLTVISTGIGTDNIDIVLQELDILANVDLKTRKVKEAFNKLEIIRIGTSGALQADLGVDTFLASKYGLGIDGLGLFYQNEVDFLAEAVSEHANIPIPVYSAAASKSLLGLFDDFEKGITVTCPGFYGPQGRVIRLQPKNKNLLDELRTFTYMGDRITNFEMETAGIYKLAALLGHEAISLNALLANRSSGIFSEHPGKIVDDLIKIALERITK